MQYTSYVAGVPVTGTNVFEVKNPYDNSIAGTVTLANAAHASAAVEVALKGGKKLSRYDRFSILDKISSTVKINGTVKCS